MPFLPEPLLRMGAREGPAPAKTALQMLKTSAGITRLGLSKRSCACSRTPPRLLYKQAALPRFPGTHPGKRSRLSRELLLRSGRTLQRSRAAAHCRSPRSTARPRPSRKPLDLGAKPHACSSGITRNAKRSQAPSCRFQEFQPSCRDAAAGLAPSTRCRCDRPSGKILLLQRGGVLLLPKCPTQVEESPRRIARRNHRWLLGLLFLA